MNDTPIDDIEQDRLETVAQLIEDRGAENAQQLAELYPVGSFGCHEVLHATSIVAELIDHRLLEHPAIATNPKWYRMAAEAHQGLFDLYQTIAAEHLGGYDEGLPPEKLDASNDD